MESPKITKLCNAFIPTASAAFHLGAVNNYKAKHGGLWVGGKVEISKQMLSFQPNKLNVALHAGDCSVHFPTSLIRSVHREFGFVSGIVVITLQSGEFRFRCFGAKGVAAEISTLLAAP